MKRSWYPGTQGDQAGFSKKTSVWKYSSTSKQANSSVSGLAEEKEDKDVIAWAVCTECEILLWTSG